MADVVAAFVAFVAFAALAPAPARADDTRDDAGAAAAARDADEVTRLVGVLLAEAEDAPARRRAAEALAQLGGEDVPAIARALDELRRTTPKGAVLAALRTAGNEGDDKHVVPEDAPPLVQRLLDAPPKATGPGSRALLATAALLPPLARAATLPALRELVRVSGDHEGALRPEVDRLVKRLGERAVPALLDARRAPEPDVKRWARRSLEALGKHSAVDMVQTKRNDVLADVLRTYASLRDPDAIPVVLSFTSSDRSLVERAAREAILVYGPDAIWKLRETYAAVLGRSAPDGATAEEVAKQLFAAYDRAKLEGLAERVDAGLALARKDDLEGAAKVFDEVLARQPLYDRRSEMAPTYVALAKAVAATDRPRAEALLRKVGRLVPDDATDRAARAELAYLEGKALLERGLPDPEPFRVALGLDAAHHGARYELDRLEDDESSRRTRLGRFGAGVGLFLLAAGGILLYGRAARRREE